MLLPGSLILNWAGPAEALRIANQMLKASAKPALFRLRFVGPEAQVPTSVFIHASGIEPLPSALPDPSWLVLVGMPGVRIDTQAPAGLLCCRRATTHYQHLDGLREAALGCDVVASSAGITTGIDLALHLIKQECGAALRA